MTSNICVNHSNGDLEYQRLQGEFKISNIRHAQLPVSETDELAGVTVTVGIGATSNEYG